MVFIDILFSSKTFIVMIGRNFFLFCLYTEKMMSPSRKSTYVLWLREPNTAQKGFKRESHIVLEIGVCMIENRLESLSFDDSLFYSKNISESIRNSTVQTNCFPISHSAIQ